MGPTPFPLGSKSNNAAYRGLVGKDFYDEENGWVVRLVRAAASVASPAKKSFMEVLSGGAYNGTVKIPDEANTQHFAGIADPNLSENLDANDLFFVVREADSVTIIAASTNVAADVWLGTIATANGRLDRVIAATGTGAPTVTQMNALKNARVLALGSAPSAAGEDVEARIMLGVNN